MASNQSPVKNRWADAWLDGLGFAIGLGMAWYFHWETRDLVWSLWLSSLVIGYAMIVWNIFGMGTMILIRASRDPGLLAQVPKSELTAGGVLIAGGLFLLAFFTVHFGGFHFVHSAFLNSFFPIDPQSAHAMPGLALYLEVFRRYWWFLPAAAIAERAAFRIDLDGPAKPPDTSVKPEDIARRLAKPQEGFTGMMAPYKNVVRLHLLIFFFAAAHFAKIDNFIVYAVVYAVYFFPWRLVRKGGAEYP